MDQMAYAGRRIGPGVALIGLGLALLGLMVAFPERLKVPPPVGYLTAGTFALAGVLALANALWGPRARAWAAVALLSCMVLPSGWISLGPGERTCSISGDFLFGFTGGLTCRIGFGIATVFGIALVL